MKKFSLCILSLCICASAFSATSVKLKISGEGAINDSTIAVGKKVSIDMYVENEGSFKGTTLGFKITSPDIKKINHPQSKTKGLNKNGDVKGYNGWDDNSIWDLGGIYVAPTDWDGNLPDILGFGGICKDQTYLPHKSEKKISFELIVDEAGTLVIDSAYFAPSGKWLFAPPFTKPKWDGPYTFKVKK